MLAFIPSLTYPGDAFGKTTGTPAVSPPPGPLKTDADPLKFPTRACDG